MVLLTWRRHGIGLVVSDGVGWNCADVYSGGEAMFAVDYQLPDREEPSRYYLPNLGRAKAFFRFLLSAYRPSSVLLVEMETGREISSWREC